METWLRFGGAGFRVKFLGFISGQVIFSVPYPKRNQRHPIIMCISIDAILKKKELRDHTRNDTDDSVREYDLHLADFFKTKVLSTFTSENFQVFKLSRDHKLFKHDYSAL